MRWLCRSLKPSAARPPRRMAAKVARRRLAGGVRTVGATSIPVRPARASAVTTWARFQSA